MRGLPIPVKKQFFMASAAVLLLSGCSSAASPEQASTSAATAQTQKPEATPASKTNQSTEGAPQPAAAAPAKPSTVQTNASGATKPEEKNPSKGSSESVQMPALEVVAEPQSMTVLVNKQRQLPDQYHPTDLVFPDVPFLLPEKSEKRQMRKEAAAALEQLFAAAKADGVALAGVSAYRTHAYQKALFKRYVEKDGLEKAKMYSAVPGTSEHETGLAIDVSGIDGKCAATSCFAGTNEATWIAKHVQEYGFIIRYPKGKDNITGYVYEPWHLRYVGTEVAQEISGKNISLEEYFGVTPAAAEKK